MRARVRAHHGAHVRVTLVINNHAVAQFMLLQLHSCTLMLLLLLAAIDVRKRAQLFLYAAASGDTARRTLHASLRNFEFLNDLLAAVVSLDISM